MVKFKPELKILGQPTQFEIPNALSCEILDYRYSHYVCNQHPKKDSIFLVCEAGKTIEPDDVCCLRFQDEILGKLKQDADDRNSPKR